MAKKRKPPEKPAVGSPSTLPKPVEEAPVDGRLDALYHVLCTHKSEAVVLYALPEGNTQIFASRYKLHLPTEEELAAEIQRERREIGPVNQLGRDDPNEDE